MWPWLSSCCSWLSLSLSGSQWRCSTGLRCPIVITFTMTPTSQFNPLAHLLWYPLSTSTSRTISQMFPTCLVFGVSEEASFKVRGKKWFSNPSHNLLSCRPVTQSSGFHEWFPSAWTLAFPVHSHPQLVTKPVHNVIGALKRRLFPPGQWNGICICPR